ncbi:2-oxo-4-hydroxy-4-carboxy-5-ureidoimidazoline decarboxylase [Kaistia sp. 32K]|uniref:2-oxo-4-hydroxy-4-carboxy-5-ureidoimidazoline decarboxylase n=1 Tax=Kaistia sp. 32K TaxID=2795690 RepID=UPI001B7D8814|nr:2-oxo-4-hydroxy-4-carboxy-5-ureidoimidazoline decarboxylase [Kaistia sp. 32K]
MSTQPLTLAAVNRMDEEAFVTRFGDIAEHSPWVAEEAGRARPYPDREAMVAAFADAVLQADEDAQRALLLAHPDLAGRAAIAGELAPESRSEQAGAGLDRMTADEYARFSRLNAVYSDRFGIPFILAVKGATKDQVLAAFEARLDNPADIEFATALTQVQRIIRFRLEDRVSE